MKVKIYIINGCPYCEKLEMMLDVANIEHEIINVDTEEGEELFEPIFQKTKSYMFPTIIVGELVFAPNISFDTIDTAFKLINLALEGKL